MVIILFADKNDSNISQMLGMPDYSYYFVQKEFRPVLEKLGETVVVHDPGIEVDAIYESCRNAGEPCVFLSFTPPHATPPGLACPTAPVFAWEFYDIPNETWNQESRHDWTAVLDSLGCGITHSDFAVTAVRRAMGQDFPVVSIPAPVWDRFARLTQPGACQPRQPGFDLVWQGQKLDTRDTETVSRAGAAHQAGTLSASASIELDFDQPADRPAEATAVHTVRIDGVIYTSVFNPDDGRKNWLELVRTFCLALRDREDATLVLKLTHSGLFRSHWEIRNELRRLMPFKCRVLVVDGFLEDASYERLLCGSTYTVNASLGEGQCLPLMEYMSSGKPAVAPCHTGMSDYLDTGNAFLVDSSLEPCAWPQDPRGMYRTRRHRIDAQSLEEAFRQSYRVADREPDRYRAMSESAREALRRHCSEAVVGEKLRAFLHSRLELDRVGGTTA